jgi:DUF1680 family protein
MVDLLVGDGTDLFEGLMEYYRATGDDKWRNTCLTFYRKIIEKEITIIGNGGGACRTTPM